MSKLNTITTPSVFELDRLHKLQDQLHATTQGWVESAIESHFGVDNTVDLTKTQIDEIATFGAHLAIKLYDTKDYQGAEAETIASCVLNGIINHWAHENNEDEYKY
jgi:hypothetical protein